MTAPLVKKACDACHRRKVRCTGGQPCKNCGQTNLQCTYLAVPQKKGPRGSRAKVISEIRDTQQQAVPLASPTESVKHEHSNPFDFNSSPLTPSHAQTPGLLSQQTIDICVDFFYQHLFPTYPILKRQMLQAIINARDTSHSELYCLIASLCAFVMVQPGMNLSVSGVMGESYEGEPPESRYGYASALIEDLLRVRKGVDYVEHPTLLTVQTSFFLFSSYFSLEKQNACWFYLREAATIAQMMGMHEEAAYSCGDPIESMHRRRTYWLILVTERAYAMERHKPLTLYATIELPTSEGPDEDAEIVNGFLHLINLFRCIDDEFMSLWNKAKSECSVAWLSQLQQQLLDALPSDLKTTKYQAADIRITQQWLRTIVWQLSIMNGNLSSNSPDSAMTFKYPIEIAKDLLSDLKRMDVPSMEVHGVGLIEKLFDVACTLTDVIACVPLDPSTSQFLPQELLNQFLNLIAQLRGGSSRYLPLLLAKVSDNVPSMAAPIHHMPLSITQGYAGASDNVPIPMMPQNFESGFGMRRDGTPLSSGQFSAGQQSHSHGGYPPLSTTPVVERGMMFDAYSPSRSDTPITPQSYPGQPLGQMPRSAPPAMVGGSYGKQ